MGKLYKDKHVALILLEGETEEEFYLELSNIKFKHIPKKIKNIKGNYNINNKIIDAACNFADKNPNDTFDVFICIDQEIEGTPAFNKKYVLEKLKEIKNFKKLVPVIAVLMIESLFFIDINGIYDFLRAKHTLRNPKKFSNFRKLKHQELSKLFKQFEKIYTKGHKCEGLVKKLDMDKIVSKAKELQDMLSYIDKNKKLFLRKKLK